MTAADLFGTPDEKLIQDYQEKKGKKKKTRGRNGENKDAPTSSSFTDFDDFGEDGLDWKEEPGDPGPGGRSESEEGEPMNDDNEEDSEGEDVRDNANNGNRRTESSHALRNKKLQAQTLELEQSLFEKPWKMMGEAKATDRAVDSLLDDGAKGGATPEFEVAFRPAPVRDPEEHTATLEGMIKRRILDEDWDDVVPRELPDIGVRRGGGRGGDDAPDVSQEKSKLGLGQLYEREYLKKTTGIDPTEKEQRTEEDAAKEEMKGLFAELCSQLDALSNYHFAPRPVAEEADVDVHDQKGGDRPSAIAMEEVLPLHVSKERAAAPEELYGSGKNPEVNKGGVLKGETELDQVRKRGASDGLYYFAVSVSW